MEYNLTTERNEVLTQATPWMSLKKHTEGKKLITKAHIVVNSSLPTVVASFSASVTGDHKAGDLPPGG